MANRVYIDGHVGTTGLRIRELLGARGDLTLLTLHESERKDAGARRAAILAADVSVLCLPDEAAREAAVWAAEGDARLIDASTAHRVAPGWVYGLPELAAGQRRAIAEAQYVSNPGCYPTGYLLLVRPLVDAGLLGREVAPVIHAVSGYSGGGRTMIEKWEDPAGDLLDLPHPAPYALDKVHKHVPEMRHYSGLEHAPQFCPAVCAYRCGMRVEVPLHAEQLQDGVTGKALWEALDAHHRDETFVRVIPYSDPLDADEHTFDPRACNDTNRIELRVLAHPSGHVVLMAILDNLGKGAAGAAVQNLNLMLGCPEDTGLVADTPA